MKIFGREVALSFSREKAANLSSVAESRGWARIYESFTGAWQRNIVVDRELVLANHAVFACQTLIASDISKLRVKLVEQNARGIWKEVTNAAFSPVLRKPNHFQTRNQFWENWVLSKLMAGNTYVLKERDARQVVVALYILDPRRVIPMVADNGEVYYQLDADLLAGIQTSVLVPASEIIHDRFNCLFHPLVGVSPIFANALAATQGLNAQNNSALLFANGSQPGGILTAPGQIAPEAAARLKANWEASFTGKNSGRVAVLGDGLTYTKMALTAVEGQVIEQMKWTAEVVCSTYHVPPYKVGVGALPSYNNVQTLNVEYYSECLQTLIEAAETCLDEGLGLDTAKDGGRMLGTEFDVDNLLRMDSVTQMEVLDKGVKAAILSPNEARQKLDYDEVDGGESPLSQQQNFSLAALAKRDALPNPFDTAQPAATETPPANDNTAAAREARSLVRRAYMSARVGLDNIPLPKATDHG